VLRATHAPVRIHGWLDAWCLGWARFDWQGGPVWGWDGLISGSRAILFLEWSAGGGGNRNEDAVDTFVFRDGLIRVQTVRYTMQPAR